MHQDLTKQFYPFAKQQLGFDEDPEIKFVEDDDNAQNPMGYTGHYDPTSMTITIYISISQRERTTNETVSETMRRIPNERKPRERKRNSKRIKRLSYTKARNAK